MDITLTAERQMESNSQVMEAVFVASRPTAWLFPNQFVWYFCVEASDSIERWKIW